MGYGEDEDYSRIWYSTGSGDNWSEPVQLSEQPDMDSYDPQIALDMAGNPHVVWEDYNELTYKDDIYYSASITRCIVRAAVEGGHGAVDPELQAVPIGGKATVNLIPDEGYRVSAVTDNGTEVTPTPEESYTIDAVNEYHEIEASFEKSPPEQYIWYLAEGCTAGGMETWVLVQNPNAAPVTVSLTLMTDAGEKKPEGLQDQQIPSGSRRSFPLHSYVNTYDVSTLVTSAGGDIICERAMYGPGRIWAHDSVGYAP